MTTVHLGVVDVPYLDGKRTTGEVAEILESKYGIMDVFYEMHGQDVADDVARAAERALKSNKPLADGVDVSNIKRVFRSFIMGREMDGRAPGVPTQASLDRPRKRGKSSPSFVESGMFLRNFTVWVTRD
jgi:hypothetical protein